MTLACYAVCMVHVRETSLEEAFAVHQRVPEFQVHFPYDLNVFHERTKQRKTVSLVAEVEGEPAGYVVAYDRDEDGTFYCWMAGVDPSFRRMGVLLALMDYLQTWAKREGYTAVRIKTRNHRREMLAFLVKHGFHFVAVESHPDPQDNRVLLEKELDSV